MPTGPVPEEDPQFEQTLPTVIAGRKLFQRFTLQKALGGDGMGMVWLARDDRLQHFVALKLFQDAACFDSSVREELKRETQRSLTLSHPNIVRIFGFLSDEQNAAISMEYVDGATLSALREWKRSKCFSVSELTPWVASLCDAMAYAHGSARIIHRGLKPSNLMVNTQMELKVTDFGIAGIGRGSTRGSDGTLGYMSPQRVLGEAPSASDDIYALGATLYELLSSQPPFTGDVVLQVRDVKPPSIAERREKLGITSEAVPKRWEDAIAACLSNNPEKRPRTATDMARRLRLGGTIRLADSQPKASHKINRSIAVGIGGIVAVTAAAFLAFRFSHPTGSEVEAVVTSAQPASFAIAPESSPAPPPASPPHFQPEGNDVHREQTATPMPASPPPVEPPQTGALLLTTSPAGTKFALYPGIVPGPSVPDTAPILDGSAPQAIEGLPPGRYTLFFQSEGWPDGRMEVAIFPGEVFPVDYTFQQGSATITSSPAGAEIFLGTLSLGRTPVTVKLPAGKQLLTARSPDRPERTQTVVVEPGTPAKVAFQMPAQSQSQSRAKRTPSRSKSRAKRKPPESTLEKFRQSLKDIFSRKSPSPPPRKKS